MTDEQRPLPNGGATYLHEWEATGRRGHTIHTDKMYAVCRAIAHRDAWFAKWERRFEALQELVSWLPIARQRFQSWKLRRRVESLY